MTREKFQAQFETQVIYDDDNLASLRFDTVLFNTPVFRDLNKLVIIKDDGHYYMHF